jgi:uncharacterized protein YerC
LASKTAHEKRRAKYADIMRQRGTPLMITVAELEEVRVHCSRLYNRGMSYRQIADTAPYDMNETTVAKVINGWHETTIHRNTYEALKQTYYVPPTGWRTGRHMDSIGVRRRIQALVADGFGYNVIGPVMGISLQAVYQLATRDADTFASTYGYVVPVYEKLAGKDPAQYGATKLGISRARGAAARHGWTPSHTWDPDTIDDPDAFPEWTGACGTVTGYNLHRKEQVHVKVIVDRNGNDRMTVLCDACCRARVESKSDHAQRLQANRDRCIEMLGDNATVRHIAEELGMSTRTVLRIKKEQEA